MIRSLWLFPLLLLAFFVQEGRVPAQDVLYRPAIKAADIESGLRTDWYGLYLNGKKNGYFKTTRSRAGDTVVESFILNMKVVSMDIKAEIKISQTLTFEGKAPFRLLGGVFKQEDGANKLVITVTRDTDKSFKYVVDVGGNQRVRKVDDLDYSLPDALASETWLRSAPKEGDRIVGKDLDLQEWKTDQTKYLLMAIKSVLVGGVEVKYYEVESESKKDMVKLISRNDDKGNLLQGTIGGLFELRKETEVQARNTQYSEDLFLLGQAKIDRKIGYPTRLTELVLEVEGKGGEVIENGPRQTITVEKPGVRRIKIGKKYGNDIKAAPEEIEESLAETNSYAVKDPKVVALARKAVGNAKTPQEKVERIVAFVHNYIQGEAVATLPNIHDLIEKKQGDCKSYALLTTNLCRAAGIPAREVSGLVYMGDNVKAFGGHAWNEVVLGGVWVPVDASRGQAEVDAGHISLGTEQRANKGMLESLGKLSFKVIESQVRNR
jgi:protein-glutamine gamma-glutamyltransferase